MKVGSDIHVVTSDFGDPLTLAFVFLSEMSQQLLDVLP